MDTILALDFGTQGVKALLADEGITVRARTRAAYGFTVNERGHMEQSPEDWRRAMAQALQALAAADPAGYRSIAAVGITGQMHGAVLLGEDNAPLGDAIVWCDTRCVAEAAELDAMLQEALRRRLKNRALTAYTAPKLLWVRRHQPERFSHIAKLVFCKDYVRHLLCSGFITDHSDASGSLLYDFETGGWSADTARLIGLGSDVLPEIARSCEIAGRVSAGAARAYELAEGIPVAVGAGDLAASLFGNGISGAGQALVNLGTAGQVLTLSPGDADRDPGGHLFRFLDETTGMMLYAIPSAAYCLRWFLEKVATQGAEGKPDFAALDMWAAACPPGARGVFFAPYLSGTGSPYLDDAMRGAFLGLDAGHGAAEMARAMLEGVAYGIRDCLESMGGAARFERIAFSGGGAASPLWRGIFANVLGRPLYCSDQTEAAGLGACLIAACAAGLFTGPAEAAASVRVGECVWPDQSQTVGYEALYGQFRRIYPALRAL